MAQKVQATELTGKKWKLWMLLGGAAMAFSLVVGGIMGYPAYDSGVVMALAAIGFLGGFAFYVAGRVGAWWFHG